MAAVYEEARRLLGAGVSVIPIRTDGSKAPEVSWAPYQERLANQGEVSQWWNNGHRPGIGIIGGAISGNLEILDFDQADLFEPWAELVETEAPGLLKRLVMVQTPGPGRHAYYRCSDTIDRNRKLARVPKENGGWEVLIETRGEGGYVLAPGSPPSCHPSGQPYEIVQGDLAALPILTTEERTVLLEAAQALNRYAEPEVAAEPTRSPLTRSAGALSPGDDYNTRGDWPALLMRHGWTLDHTRGEVEHWRRPGKTVGTSATLHAVAPGVLYVFSSNAAPFPADKAFDLFRAYTWLEHGGDFKKAALALKREGYGAAPERGRERQRARLKVHPQASDPDEILNTDLGNARRLVLRHGHDLRYTESHGWLCWDGKRWQRDGSGEVMRRAKETARAILVEASKIDDARQQRELVQWAQQSQSAARLAQMIELAKSEPEIVIADAGALDGDPWLFNCLNGTIDLRSGTLHPHRRSDLITNLAPVEYIPDASDPVWDRFIETATGGDREFSAYLQRAAGQTLSGDTSEDLIFFALGPTRTGKSTLLAALKATMGDYAASAEFETFLLSKRETAGARPDLARLAGKRFVAAVESERGGKFALGRLKNLSGGDGVTCRFLFKDTFTYMPQFTLWLAANDAPDAPDDDDAFWERLRRLPFIHRPPKIDPHVREHLRNPKKAGAAILAWAVRGCLEWQNARQEGLGTPQVIRDATSEYRAEMDPLKDFFPEYAILGSDYQANSTSLWEAYQTFARENRIGKTLSRNQFADQLRKRGCDSDHTKKGTLWNGVGIVSSLSPVTAGDSAKNPSAGTQGDSGDGGDSHFRKVFTILPHEENFSDSGVTAVTGVTVITEMDAKGKMVDPFARVPLATPSLPRVDPYSEPEMKRCGTCIQWFAVGELTKLSAPDGYVTYRCGECGQ